MSLPSESPALNPAPVEPCPVPLVWQEVVRNLREQARPIEFSNSEALIQGLDFGSGSPLVFLPPAAGTAILNSLTAWLLKDHARCLLLENLQWTRRPSSRQHAPASARCWGEWLRHSFSGPVDLIVSGASILPALSLLQNEPHLIRRLVVLGGGLGKRLTWLEWLMLQGAQWLRGALEEVRPAMAIQAQNHAPWFPPFDHSRFEFLMQEIGRQPVADVALRLLSEAGPAWPDTARIQHSMMLIHCEGEGARIQKEMQRLERLCLHPQRESLHSAGLFPALTHPHRLVKLLKGFLELSAPSSTNSP